MQNKTRQYAKVLLESVRGKSEQEVGEKIKRFKEILKKHGANKKISEILMEFSRLWKERDGKLATIVSARPLSLKVKSEIQNSLKEKDYVMEEKIDPEAIGGMAIFLGNEYLIDGTIKGKLKRLERIMSK